MPQSQPKDELTKEEKALAMSFYLAFTTENGKEVYDHFEAEYHNRLSFDPDSQEITAYNEGTRAVFLQIKNMVALGKELI